MFVLKFKAVHKDCRYIDAVQKTNTIVYTYPLGSFRKSNKIYFSAVHLLEGDRKKFTSILKKDKAFKRIEFSGGLIFTLVEEDYKRGYYDPSYDPNLFFPKPIITKPDGYEYWEAASWERGFLEKLVKILQDKRLVPDYKILKFGQDKLADFIFPKIIPNLTEKQKKAIKLAFDSGYYEFPKKTNLTNLGKQMRISKQAYQKLLSKAEKNLIPFVLE